MKNTFLISAAAVALLTATGMASAQSTMDQRLPPAAGQLKAQESDKSESSEQKAKAGAQIKAGEKSKSKAQAEGKAGIKVDTTGQAPAAKQSEMKSQQENQKQDSSKSQTTQSKSGADAASSSSSGASAKGQSSGSAGASTQGKTETTGAAAANVNLTAEQKTTIRETVLKQSNAPRVSNVNFSISVGTVVPRKSMRFAPVPRTLIEIHPAWRGYEYFLIGDQIVVVDPRTLRIVAILSV